MQLLLSQSGEGHSWFVSLPKQMREAYLAKHPNSKFAQTPESTDENKDELAARTALYDKKTQHNEALTLFQKAFKANPTSKETKSLRKEADRVGNELSKTKAKHYTAQLNASKKKEKLEKQIERLSDEYTEIVKNFAKHKSDGTSRDKLLSLREEGLAKKKVIDELKDTVLKLNESVKPVNLNTLH